MMKWFISTDTFKSASYFQFRMISYEHGDSVTFFFFVTDEHHYPLLFQDKANSELPSCKSLWHAGVPALLGTEPGCAVPCPSGSGAAAGAATPWPSPAWRLKCRRQCLTQPAAHAAGPGYWPAPPDTPLALWRRRV